MAPKIATAEAVGLSELLDFVRPRHRMVLTTFRADGSLQSSPVTGGVDEQGRVVIASYPQRAKSANIRRTPRASVVVLSDEFNGAYGQIDGDAEVIDVPEAGESLVDYYRAIAGVTAAQISRARPLNWATKSGPGSTMWGWTEVCRRASTRSRTRYSDSPPGSPTSVNTASRSTSSC